MGSSCDRRSCLQKKYICMTKKNPRSLILDVTVTGNATQLLAMRQLFARGCEALVRTASSLKRGTQIARTFSARICAIFAESRPMPRNPRAASRRSFRDPICIHGSVKRQGRRPDRTIPGESAHLVTTVGVKPIHPRTLDVLLEGLDSIGYLERFGTARLRILGRRGAFAIACVDGPSCRGGLLQVVDKISSVPRRLRRMFRLEAERRIAREQGFVERVLGELLWGDEILDAAGGRARHGEMRGLVETEVGIDRIRRREEGRQLGEKGEEEEEQQRRHLDPQRRRRLRASSSSSSLSRHWAAPHANPARAEELERRAAASEGPAAETSARPKGPAEPSALASSEEHAEELFRRDIFAAETALEPRSGCASPREPAGATAASSAARIRIGARLIIYRAFVGIAQHLESFRDHWAARKWFRSALSCSRTNRFCAYF